MTTDAYLETRVLTADPIELTHMLYQRAIDLVGEARQGLRNRRVERLGGSDIGLAAREFRFQFCNTSQISN